MRRPEPIARHRLFQNRTHQGGFYRESLCRAGLPLRVNVVTLSRGAELAEAAKSVLYMRLGF